MMNNWIKSTLFVVLVSAGISTRSQEVLEPFSSVQNVQSTFKSGDDTLTLPLQIVPEKSGEWMEFVQHSSATFSYLKSGLPTGPGVITFDGFDESGYPYSESNGAKGYADTLVSKPIDLPYSLSDSVALSFYFLGGGAADQPELTDTLFLDFKKMDGTWQRVWHVVGSDMLEMEYAYVPLTDEEFLSDAFQFRFGNYGGLVGDVDVWLLNHIYVDVARRKNIRINNDVAVVPNNPAVLKSFTGIPWKHALADFSKSYITDTTKVTVFNRWEEDKTLKSVAVSISYKGNEVFQFEKDNLNLSLPAGEYSDYELVWGENGNPELTLPVNQLDSFPSYEVCYSIAVIGTNEWTGNDVYCYDQHIWDYYAWDDGEADKAYGINEIGARVALKYSTLKTDSLVGVRMKFNPVATSLNNKSFILAAWSNLENDEVLTENSGFSQPAIGTADENGFVNYYFEQPERVADEFYIGFIQTTSSPLSVGFDFHANKPNHLFYSLSGLGWTGSSFTGVPMMQPIFKSERSEAGVEESQLNVFSMYPNPTEGVLNFENNTEDGAIYSISGQLVKRIPSGIRNLDLADVQKGLYLVVIGGVSRKLIIE